MPLRSDQQRIINKSSGTCTAVATTRFSNGSRHVSRRKWRFGTRDATDSFLRPRRSRQREIVVFFCGTNTCANVQTVIVVRYVKTNRPPGWCDCTRIRQPSDQQLYRFIVYIVYRALRWLLLSLDENSYRRSILRLAFSRERVKPSRRYSQITRSEGFWGFCKHPANRSLLFCAAVLRFFRICLPKDSESFASIVDHDHCGLFYKYSLDRFLRSLLIPGIIDHFDRIYFDIIRMADDVR